MIFTTFILAFLPSIDAFGIGISYNLTGTKLPRIATITLFLTMLFITSITLVLCIFLKHFLNDILASIFGSIILIVMGLSMLIKSNKNSNCDLDNSKEIDCKEAILLGIAMSMDCVGVIIGAIATGSGNICLPILLSLFHTIILKLGFFLGEKIKNTLKFSKKIITILPGICLILIGLFKIFNSIHI